ncbi:MAG: class IV adenylate cyclase [Omnitrophica WOR_2 bacterium]
MAADNQEVEVKFLLSDRSSLEKKLKTAGAKLDQPRVYEINLRFDTPEGKLARNQQVLRLRQDTRARLTFKGPAKFREEVQSRQELEFTVSSFEMAKALLEALGYQVAVMYEKFRATYVYEQTEITLDEMPYGNFAEIEGPDGKAIQAVARKLGLDWDRRILESYMALFDRARSNLRFSFRDLSFENFKSIQAPPSALGLNYADQKGGKD